MKIYQTYKNSDEVEGRGPMVPDLAFLREDHANNYIDNQPGIMGRHAEWSQMKYGDWEVREIEVLDYDVIQAGQEKVKLRMKALAKLTKEDKELLGLTE